MILSNYLKDHTLLFDGGYGFYYQQQYTDGSSCEQANLSYPERILEMHRAYIAAGAQAIKTNTFAANTESMETPFSHVAESIRAAWDLANQAVSDTSALVFADIGPMSPFADSSEYQQIVDVFLSLGAKYFLFETFSELDIQLCLAKKIKQTAPDAFILCSFAVNADGYTSTGCSIDRLFSSACASSYIDAVGMNCVSGPSHMVQLVKGLKKVPDILSVMPNAGYPSLIRGKMHFGGKPEFFAERASELVSLGVRILGGCCGTTPEFIHQTASKIIDAPKEITTAAPIEQNHRTAPINHLSEKLDQGKRVIALELDPPDDDNIAFFVDGARRLRDAGIDAITIADCPIARARADSSMLAAKLHRELGLDPIPHMTCRDRNINATRALLLGLSIEDVHNVLLVTGDPVPSSERESVKAVYSFNSARLAAYLKSLGENGTVAPFRIFGALNVNAPNFNAELKKAQRKEESGITGFLTQPVITDQAFENLALAHQTLTSPILGGIYPIISQRNALFMNNEVSGIDVSQEIIDLYAGLNREEGEDLAVQLSVKAAKRMLPYTAGWYLMTPFKRISLMERVVREIRKITD